MTPEQLRARLDQLRLWQVIADAQSKKEQIGIENITRPERVLIFVESTKGLIDNGGFTFLFKCKVDKKNIISSFETIGASQAVVVLNEAFAEFPNEQPHDDIPERLKFIEQKKLRFEDLARKIWKLSDEIDRQLMNYAKKTNPAAFE